MYSELTSGIDLYPSTKIKSARSNFFYYYRVSEQLVSERQVDACVESFEALAMLDSATALRDGALIINIASRSKNQILQNRMHDKWLAVFKDVAPTNTKQASILVKFMDYNPISGGGGTPELRTAAREILQKMEVEPIRMDSAEWLAEYGSGFDLS